jgi:hypothetical protein
MDLQLSNLWTLARILIMGVGESIQLQYGHTQNISNITSISSNENKNEEKEHHARRTIPSEQYNRFATQHDVPPKTSHCLEI